MRAIFYLGGKFKGAVNIFISSSFVSFRCPHFCIETAICIQSTQGTSKETMELRKVEQELEDISSEWKVLRRKRPRFQDDAAGGLPTGDEALFTQMPSWKELQTKVNDDDLFPEDEDEDPGSDVVIKDEGVSSGVDTTNNNNNESNNADGDTAGYSEFGMCLAPSSTPEASGEGSKKEESSRSGGKNGGSIFDRYAAKSAAPAKPKDTDQKKAISPKQTEEEVEVEEEVPSNIENAEPKSILAELESIEKRFLALGPKIEKFMTKLKDVSICLFILFCSHAHNSAKCLLYLLCIYSI